MGRTIVITGATTGIGAALRQRLQQRGDSVINVDIRDADIIADLTAPADQAPARVLECLAGRERSLPSGDDGRR